MIKQYQYFYQNPFIKLKVNWKNSWRSWGVLGLTLWICLKASKVYLVISGSSSGCQVSLKVLIKEPLLLCLHESFWNIFFFFIQYLFTHSKSGDGKISLVRLWRRLKQHQSSLNLPTITQTSMAIDHKIYVSEFISDKLEGFFAIHWMRFSLESFESKFSFSFTKVQTSVT